MSIVTTSLIVTLTPFSSREIQEGLRVVSQTVKGDPQRKAKDDHCQETATNHGDEKPVPRKQPWGLDEADLSATIPTAAHRDGSQEERDDNGNSCEPSHPRAIEQL